MAQQLSYHLLDATGSVLASQDADRAHYAASTIKLHLLIAGLRQVDAGRLGLDETVPATRSFTAEDGSTVTFPDNHIDPSHPEPGQPISIRDLLVRIIDRSSNEATNHLIDLVGLDEVARIISDLELSGTRVERRIADPVATARGLTNESTAADLARTMQALVSNELHLSSSSHQLAVDALLAQQIRIIAAALPLGTRVGSKSGTVEGNRHDVAFIGDPGSPEIRYLAVMTSGYDQKAADDLIWQITDDLLST